MLTDNDYLYVAGVDGVSFMSGGCRLIGGFYKGQGLSKRPTAILLHGLPGIEKNLDIAYRLRDVGWNCLYFHFRGSWGSEGNYNLAHLADDTQAAIDWVVQQDCVNAAEIFLIGSSTGSHPAIEQAARDIRIRAVVGIGPVVVPAVFSFPEDMADEIARMLTGINGKQLRTQWEDLSALDDSLKKLGARPVLLVTAGNDSICPVRDYFKLVNNYRNIELVENETSDHNFSMHRVWLVQTVTDWLLKQTPVQNF